jgi:hypothetical protein
MLICLVGVVALVLLTKLRPGREDVVEFGPEATAAATTAEPTASDDDAAAVTADASPDAATDDPGPTRAGDD